VADSEDEREVLTSLPRSRPTRRSSKRGERAAGASADEAPEDPSARAKPATSSARPKPAASSARAKPASSARAKPASSARAKPASSARAKPAPASDRAKRQPRPPTHDEQPAATERPRRPPERKVPAAGYAAPASGDQEGSPGATEILSTAIQAVAELAQIGFSVGRQVLRSALERLPKP